MAEKSTIHVLMNPISGRQGRRAVLDDLLLRLHCEGFTVARTVSEGPDSPRKAALRACQDQAAVLIVWGGDGTVSGVVNGLLPVGMPILPLPGGTANILAKYLGIRLDIDWLIELIRNRHTVPFDILECCPIHSPATSSRPGNAAAASNTSQSLETRRFALVAGAGFDGECTRLLAERRRGHISYLNYVAPIWQAFWNYRHPVLSIEADGERVFEGRGLALIGNVPNYAIGLKVFPDSQPWDGRFTLCVFPCTSRLRLFGHAARVLMQDHTTEPDVIYRQVRSVKICSAEPVPIQLDGDFFGWLPAEFRMCREQAHFLAS